MRGSSSLRTVEPHRFVFYLPAGVQPKQLIPIRMRVTVGSGRVVVVGIVVVALVVVVGYRRRGKELPPV